MTRTFTAADGLNPEDLYHSGHDHGSAAAALANTSPGHLDSAGYLAHMAVELVLKAWLLQSAQRFEGIHSLIDLYKTLQANHGAPPLKEEQSHLLALLDSYSELRYPNRKAPTEVGTEDIGELPAFMDFLYSNFPAALQESISKLDPLAKGGRVLMRKKIDS